MLAGLAFELTPYRLAQTSHLQVLMNGWMPIGLLALHRYFASGSRWWLAAFAAVFVVLGLSNGYYLYFFRSRSPWSSASRWPGGRRRCLDGACWST